MTAAPSPMAIAKAHEQEIRRLAQAMSIEQTQLSRLLVGRKCCIKGKSGPVYRVVLVTFNIGGHALIHGSLWSRKRRFPLGDLNSIELI